MDSPGQNTGVGSLSLLQGIFPTHRWNPGLPHCTVLYQLSHREARCWDRAHPKTVGAFIWSFIFWLIVCSIAQPVRLFATPWTVAHQAPLSKGFSRQEYWTGLPCPPPGDLSHLGMKPSVRGLSCLLSGRRKGLGFKPPPQPDLWPHGERHSPRAHPPRSQPRAAAVVRSFLLPAGGRKSQARLHPRPPHLTSVHPPLGSFHPLSTSRQPKSVPPLDLQRREPPTNAPNQRAGSALPPSRAVRDRLSCGRASRHESPVSSARRRPPQPPARAAPAPTSCVRGASPSPGASPTFPTHMPRASLSCVH